MEGPDLKHDPEKEQLEKKKDAYPKHSLFFLFNEFFESYCYYGILAITTIFLNRHLSIPEDTSTAIYHGLQSYSYFTPVIGAMIADGYLGKFRTTVIFSIIYILGAGALTVSGLPPPDGGIRYIAPAVGLILLGLGRATKSCAYALGADQFGPDQTERAVAFFSIFYIFNNAATIVSCYLTPHIRAHVICFGGDCYSLAIGHCAIMIVIGSVIFIAGYKWYHIPEPEGDVVTRMFKTIGSAIKHRRKWEGKPKDHWLEYADEDPDFIEDLKSVLRVLLIFVPLPAFWALWDQQNSRWSLQGNKMDGDVAPGFSIKADQMTTVNAFMVTLSVPVLDYLIFPLLRRCRIPTRPLQRIGAGMFLAGISFIIAAVLQFLLDRELTPPVTNSQSDIRFINGGPCTLEAHGGVLNSTIDYGTVAYPGRIAPGDYVQEFTSVCQNNRTVTGRVSLSLKGRRAYSVLVVDDGTTLKFVKMPQLLDRTERGQTTVRVINAMPFQEEADVSLRKGEINVEFENVTYLAYSRFNDNINPNRYDIYYNTKTFHPADVKIGSNVYLKIGGVYSLLLHAAKEQFNKTVLSTLTDVAPNSFNILYMFPQYIVMAVAEVLFNVTGMAFAYSQAPESMKAVVESGWLMTNCIGNLIVVFVAMSPTMKNQAVEYLIFAGMLFLFLLIFAFLAKRYKYVSISIEISEDDLVNGTVLVPLDSKEEDSKELVVATVYPSTGIDNPALDITAEPLAIATINPSGGIDNPAFELDVTKL